MMHRNTDNFQDDGSIIPAILTILFFVGLFGSFIWLVLIQPVIATKAIHRAAERGDLSEVQKLVKQGTSVDLEGPYGHTPLWIALDNSHVDVVNYLLSKGASGKGALHPALRTRDIEIVRQEFQS